MGTRYARGRQIEWKAQHELEKKGLSTIRTAGSHGLVDVIAWSDEEIIFIQCKRSKVPIKAACSFAADLEEMRNSRPLRGLSPKLRKIARVELWVWVDRKGFQKIPVP